MNTIFSLKTEGGNLYTLNRDLKHIFLTHPQLVKTLYEEDDNDVDPYYKGKAIYLKEHGYLDKLDNQYTGRISPDMVYHSLQNLEQLTFAVTDSCNLKCKYCGYGELYSDYEDRNNKMINPVFAYRMLDYFKDIWDSADSPSLDKHTYISFYGGEPLMNVPFIRDVINYLEQLNIVNRSFEYSMTTNALLLDRYMDFLVEQSFHLLISLDGDKVGNSYRVRQDGTEPFDKILANIDLLKEKYPDYFEKNVGFNAVLHNRNSVKGIYDFIHERYNKVPRISELNATGIKPDKREEFEQTYKNKQADLYQSENYVQLEEELYMQASSYSNACLFLHRLCDNVIVSYDEFFEPLGARTYIPTGTCLPFSRKMFITVNGKILPCERIGHQFALGTVSEEGVCLDVNYIVERHNRYLDKLQRMCSKCLRSKDCAQCFYNLDTLDDEKVVCHAYSSVDSYMGEFGDNMSFFEKHPEAYERLMTKVIIS